jgi:hypothetical protein
MDNVEVLKRETQKESRVSSRIYHKKNDREKRSILVKIYVNEEEKKQLDKDAQMVGKDLSKFCRELYLQKKNDNLKRFTKMGNFK